LSRTPEIWVGIDLTDNLEADRGLKYCRVEIVLLLMKRRRNDMATERFTGDVDGE